MWCGAPAMMAAGAAELPNQATLHQDMDSPSLMGGLFDIIGSKHDPPDFPEIDPDLLSTLNSTRRISNDSLDGSITTDDATMMDNWQMNEVFQDISDILMEPETDAINNDEVIPLAARPAVHEKELDDLLMDVFPNNSLQPEYAEGATSVEVPVGSPSPLHSAVDTTSSTVDLSWIIQQTLGDDAGDSAAETSVPSHRVSVEEYDLLSQLELMPPADDDVEAAEVDSAVSSPTDASSISSDHQYTQLADVRVKPHETKKQAIRRVKNNAASRVCRRQRKNRLTSNMDRVKELTDKNNELRSRISEVESVVSLLKEHLVKATKK